MINAGQMDQRVTLRVQGTAEDALGQRIAGWSDVVTVWARVRPVKGREYEAAGAEQALSEFEIDIRWRAGVTTAMRARWRGRDHDVLAVTEPFAGRETLRLHCRGDA